MQSRKKRATLPLQGPWTEPSRPHLQPAVFMAVSGSCEDKGRIEEEARQQSAVSSGLGQVLPSPLSPSIPHCLSSRHLPRQMKNPDTADVNPGKHTTSRRRGVSEGPAAEARAGGDSHQAPVWLRANLGGKPARAEQRDLLRFSLLRIFNGILQRSSVSVSVLLMTKLPRDKSTHSKTPGLYRTSTALDHRPAGSGCHDVWPCTPTPIPGPLPQG